MSKPVQVIGRAEHVELPGLLTVPIPARVDTGAKTSALWASNITEKDGTLSYELFDKNSQFYTGQTVVTRDYAIRLVANSSGQVESRYAVKHLIIVNGRKVRATFTLANRASQVYPILVGRNILRGKFIVDVKLGKPLSDKERQREEQKRVFVDMQKGGGS